MILKQSIIDSIVIGVSIIVIGAGAIGLFSMNSTVQSYQAKIESHEREDTRRFDAILHDMQNRLVRGIPADDWINRNTGRLDFLEKEFEKIEELISSVRTDVQQMLAAITQELGHHHVVTRKLENKVHEVETELNRLASILRNTNANN